MLNENVPFEHTRYNKIALYGDIDDTEQTDVISSTPHKMIGTHCEIWVYS